MLDYRGIKFIPVFISKKIPNNPKIRDLKRWCKIFHQYNLAPPYLGGSAGNLSFRLNPGKNVFVITGSRIGLKDQLGDECFVTVQGVDMEKGIVYTEGEREPSSESMLHFAIYSSRPKINAIFHGHSQEILSKAESLGIPHTLREEPYGTLALVHSVLEILQDIPFLIMKNHGFIAMGETMESAGELTLNIYQQKNNQRKRGTVL